MTSYSHEHLHKGINTTLWNLLLLLIEEHTVSHRKKKKKNQRESVLEMVIHCNIVNTSSKKVLQNKRVETGPLYLKEVWNEAVNLLFDTGCYEEDGARPCQWCIQVKSRTDVFGSGLCSSALQILWQRGKLWSRIAAVNFSVCAKVYCLYAHHWVSVYWAERLCTLCGSVLLYSQCPQ